MTHMDMNEKEIETNRDTLDKLMKECPDITSPAMMDIFIRICG